MAAISSGPAFLLAREIAACGLLMHHWLLGRAPFGEPDMPTLLGRLTTTDLRLPLELSMPVPLSLRLIVDRSTDLHPQRRFVHARSFERVLSAHGARPVVAKAPPASRDVSAETSDRRPARRRTAAAR